jgi:hypothetical protein
MDFETYETLTGYNEEAKLDQFKQGIDPLLAEKIIGTFPIPTTLAEWKACGLVLDQQYQIFKRTATSQQKSSSSRGASAPPQTVSTPFRAQTPRTTGSVVIKKEPVDVTFAGVTCFNCGGSRHYANACPSAKKAKDVATTTSVQTTSGKTSSA